MDIKKVYLIESFVIKCGVPCFFIQNLDSKCVLVIYKMAVCQWIKLNIIIFMCREKRWEF